VIEVFQERGQAVVGDGLDHAGFDGVDIGLGRVQAASALVGEGGRAGASGGDGVRAGEQAVVLEGAQDHVHGLAGDEGGAGEFGVGQAGARGEHLQTGVLRHGQRVGAQRPVHGAAQSGVGLLEPVAHMAEYVFGRVGRFGWHAVLLVHTLIPPGGGLTVSMSRY
jgi:hypothetical protein